MSTAEELLLRGWLNANYCKPTPKDFCSYAVGAGARGEGGREPYCAFIAHEVFSLREAGDSIEQIVAKTSIPKAIVGFTYKRATRRTATDALFRIELAANYFAVTEEEAAQLFTIKPGDITIHPVLHRNRQCRYPITYKNKYCHLREREWPLFQMLVADLDRYCGMLELMSSVYEDAFTTDGTVYFRKRIEFLHTTLAEVGIGIYALEGKGFRLGTAQ